MKKKRAPSRSVNEKKQKRDAMPMPQTLYAVEGFESEPKTFFGYASFDMHDEGDRVGVYELREVRTLHVTRGLR